MSSSIDLIWRTGQYGFQLDHDACEGTWGIYDLERWSLYQHDYISRPEDMTLLPGHFINANEWQLVPPDTAELRHALVQFLAMAARHYPGAIHLRVNASKSSGAGLNKTSAAADSHYGTQLSREIHWCRRRPKRINSNPETRSERTPK